MDAFIEQLLEHICAEIPDPGAPAAMETFAVKRPEGMTDAEWDAFVREMSRARRDQSPVGHVLAHIVGI